MVKLVHMAIVNCDRYDVEELGKALKQIKEKLGNKYEFLITNDRIQARDPKMLFKEYKLLIEEMKKLYELYEEKEKKLEEKK